jgi:hypothetical protein
MLYLSGPIHKFQRKLRIVVKVPGVIFTQFGTNKLECYITLDRKGWQRRNTLAYWAYFCGEERKGFIPLRPRHPRPLHHPMLHQEQNGLFSIIFYYSK